MVMSVISSVLAAFFCFGLMFASTDNDVDNVRKTYGEMHILFNCGVGSFPIYIA